MIAVELNMENLIGLLLGWPSLAVASGLAITGTCLARPFMLWLAVALSSPVALYVSASPRLPFVGIIPIAALVIAAFTCRKESRWPSFLSVTVYGLCVGALAYVAVVN